MKMNKTGKRLSLLLMGLLFSLLLLEGALQILAYLNFRQSLPGEEGTAPDQAGAQVVLCIGDSFTFGSGSTDRSLTYPAQLQACLDRASKDTGKAWQVVNRGWPGRNSSELMQRIPTFLHEVNPDFVCILIGKNDTWSTAEVDLPPPTLDSAAPAGRDYQWRCRTFRLLTLLWAQLTSGADSAGSENSSAGSADGIDPSGNSTGGKGTNRSDDPAAEPDTAQAVKKKPKPKPANPKLYQAKEYKALKKAMDLFRNNDPESAGRIVAEVKPRIRNLDNIAAASLYLQAINSLNYHEEVIEESLFNMEKYGKSKLFCSYLIIPLSRMGRHEEALQWSRETLALMEPDEDQGGIYRARASIHRAMGNRSAALEDAFQAFSHTGNEKLLENDITKTPRMNREARDSIPALLNALDLGPEVEAKILQIVARVYDRKAANRAGAGENTVLGKLKADLGHIIAMVEQSGARAVLLTYPNPATPSPAISDCARETAQAKGVGLADMTPVFTRLLEIKERDGYFIPDGHCNDAGYGVMAKQVTALLLSLTDEED